MRVAWLTVLNAADNSKRIRNAHFPKSKVIKKVIFHMKQSSFCAVELFVH